MRFGDRVRELRQKKDWTLRDLAQEVGVGFTYLSRVENERLNYGDYPSDALIHRLADALDCEEDELLVLAKKVPERIRQRVLKRPDAFALIAQMSDDTLDEIISQYRRKGNRVKN